VTLADERRLVLFEVGGSAFALPIADVVEVAEWAAVAAIPSLPPAIAGVVNHHGDALPLLSREALLDATITSDETPESVLVLGASGLESGRLGVPVDRVLGLVDAPLGPPAAEGIVVERRPVRGRIVAVLDAARLLERAARVIEEGGERA
jgi:chemotaxis signal transduction protein